MNIKQGDSFTANIRGINTEGKISFCIVDGEDFMVLCQNDVIGGAPRFFRAKFERYGYKYIYVLTKNSIERINKNLESVRNFQLIQNRKERIENLNI